MICPICNKDLNKIAKSFGSISLREIISIHWQAHMSESVREVLEIFDEAVEYYDDPRVEKLRKCMDDKLWNIKDLSEPYEYDDPMDI